MATTPQRVLAAAALLTVGILSLPLAAAILDSPRTENWIIPVQLIAVAAIGAALTVAIPALARAGASTGTRALTGMAWGLIAAITGLIVFWLLLNGFSGA